MNRKIIFSSFLACTLILMIGLKLVEKENKEAITPSTPIEKEEVFLVLENQNIDMCLSDECDIQNKTIYPEITIDLKIDEVQEKITEINNETKKYYEEVLNSNFETEECLEYKKIYKHSINYYTDYDLYNDKNYISIAIRRIKTNLCTKEITYLEPVVYLYDKTEHKFFNTEDIFHKKEITEEQVQKSIQKNIELNNKFSNTNFTIENTYQNGIQNLKVYYTSLGELYIYYLQNEDGNYYTAPLEE